LLVTVLLLLLLLLPGTVLGKALQWKEQKQMRKRNIPERKGLLEIEE
jgi:hypothetical protein